MKTFKPILIILFLFLTSLQMSICQECSPFTLRECVNKNGNIDFIEIDFDISNKVVDGCNLKIFYQNNSQLSDTIFCNYITEYDSKNICKLIAVNFEDNKYFYPDTIFPSKQNSNFIIHVNLEQYQVKCIGKIECRYVDINNGPSRLFSIRIRKNCCLK